MALPLIDINDVAERLHLGVQTMYNWRGRGIGPPAVKIGNRVRWRPEAVEQWIREQETLHVQHAPLQFDPEQPTRRRAAPRAAVLDLPKNYKLTARDRLVLFAVALDPTATFTDIAVATGLPQAAVTVVSVALTKRTEQRPPLLSAAWYRAQTKGKGSGLSPWAETEQTAQ